MGVTVNIPLDDYNKIMEAIVSMRNTISDYGRNKIPSTYDREAYLAINALDDSAKNDLVGNIVELIDIHRSLNEKDSYY